MKRPYNLSVIFFFILSMQADYKSLVIIIPSYNNAVIADDNKTRVERNLGSVFKQRYPRDKFKVIYCDDASTDATESEVKRFCDTHDVWDTVTYIRNESNNKLLYNLVNSIYSYCTDHDIVIMLDGDDELANREDVFEMINSLYQNPNIWCTYGEFVVRNTTDGSHPVAPYSKHIINQNRFRHEHFYFLPLRTFYAKLFKHIKISDLLQYNRFYTITDDMAWGIPLLELAGSHTQYTSEQLYIYNNNLSTNDGSTAFNKQIFFDFFTRNKKHYRPLTNLFEEKPVHLSIGHIITAALPTSLEAVKKALDNTNNTFYNMHTTLFLSWANNHLIDQLQLSSQTTLITQCPLYSTITKTTMLQQKSKLLRAVRETSAEYFIVHEATLPLPSLEVVNAELLALNDITVLGTPAVSLENQGILRAYPHCAFLELGTLGSILDLKSPSCIIIKKQALITCLERSAWVIANYFSIIAALAQFYKGHYATFVI